MIKLLVAIFAIVFRDNKRIGGFAIYYTLYCYKTLVKKCKPYKNPKQDKFDLLLSNILMHTVLISNLLSDIQHETMMIIG